MESCLFIYVPLEYATSRTVKVVDLIARHEWDLQRQFYIWNEIEAEGSERRALEESQLRKK